MAYTPIGWINDNPPAINQENLNHMDNAIKANDSGLDAITGISLIELEIGKKYRTVAAGETMSQTPETGANYACAKFAVTPGEKITIVGSGAQTSSSRLYAFANSGYVSLGRSDGNLSGKRVLEAPDNAAFMFVNILMNSPQIAVYKGISLLDSVFGLNKQNYMVNGNIGIIEKNKFLKDLFILGENRGSVYAPGRTYRCTTEIPVYIPFDISIKADEDYRFIIYKYENGSWTDTDWISIYNIPAYTLFTVVIRKSVEDTTSAADIPAFVNSLTVNDEKVTQIYNNNYLTATRHLNDSLFGLGQFRSGAYSPTTRIYRCSTINAISLDYDILIKAKPGYRFFLSVYENNAWAEYTWSTNQTVPKNCPFGFVIAKVSEDTTSTANIPEFVSNIVVDSLENQETEDDSLPNYWRVYLQNKQAELETNDMDLGFYGVSFAFITDVHVAGNAKNSPQILRYIRNNTNIQKIICGGDIINSHSDKASATEELAWWMRNTNDLDVTTIYGNHDRNVSSAGEIGGQNEITPSEFYGLECRRTESFVIYAPGALYGYSDNEDQKVRYIFLDTKAPLHNSIVIEDAQIQWMQDRIMELQTGWTVIVFAHIIFDGATKDIPTLTLRETGEKIIDGLDEIYDTANATIACLIGGHTHRNYSMISEKGYPVIITTCDTSSRAANYDPDVPNRVIGTTTEQAFDLFYIDTENRTIKITRIGAGDTTLDRDFTY